MFFYFVAAVTDERGQVIGRLPWSLVIRENGPHAAAESAHLAGER